MSLRKQGRIRLDGKAYKEMCRQVLLRDNWRCRRCGGRAHLQVHHAIVKRSKVRIDTLWNLCTLCSECHQLVEDDKVLVFGEDCNGPLIFRKADDVVELPSS